MDSQCKCPSGMFMIGSDIKSYECKFCGNDCEVCNDEQSCEKCVGDLAWDSEKLECNDCVIKGCMECAPDDPFTCINCNLGFREENSVCHEIPCYVLFCQQCMLNDEDVCEICDRYFSPDSNGICEMCSSYLCLECDGDSPDICLNCVDGYLPKNGICLDCLVDNCDECYYDYPQECSECNSGFAATDDYQCSSCAVNNCNECYLGNPTRCKTCEDGYENVNYKCLKCGVPNCNTCASGAFYKCEICEEGFKNMETVCVENCPDGWIGNGDSCELVDVNLADFMLKEDQEEYISNGYTLSFDTNKGTIPPHKYSQGLYFNYGEYSYAEISEIQLSTTTSGQL